MKLSKEAVLEVVAIVQDGILGVKDASDGLRELDLEEYDGCLRLTPEYLAGHPRSDVWEDEPNTENN